MVEMSETYACSMCSIHIPMKRCVQHLENFHVGPMDLEDLKITCGSCSFKVSPSRLHLMIRHCGLFKHDPKHLLFLWDQLVGSEETRLREIVAKGVSNHKDWVIQEPLSDESKCGPNEVMPPSEAEYQEPDDESNEIIPTERAELPKYEEEAIYPADSSILALGNTSRMIGREEETSIPTKTPPRNFGVLESAGRKRRTRKRSPIRPSQSIEQKRTRKDSEFHVEVPREDLDETPPFHSSSAATDVDPHYIQFENPDTTTDVLAVCDQASVLETTTNRIDQSYNQIENHESLENSIAREQPRQILEISQSNAQNTDEAEKVKPQKKGRGRAKKSDSNISAIMTPVLKRNPTRRTKAEKQIVSLTCNLCEQVFMSKNCIKDRVFQHVFVHNWKLAPYQCTECEFQTPRVSLFRRHSETSSLNVVPCSGNYKIKQTEESIAKTRELMENAFKGQDWESILSPGTNHHAGAVI